MARAVVTRPRILYVEGCRDGTVGGSHVSLLRLLANLDRARFEPMVAYYDEHHIATRVREMGIEVITLPNETPVRMGASVPARSRGGHSLAAALRPVQKLINFTWQVLRPAISHAWLLLRRRVDIVHLNNSINSNHEWMLAARIARVPLVSHERGASTTPSRSALWLGGWAQRHICVSNHIRDTLVASGIRAERVVVVHNGLDPREVRPRREARAVRSEYGIPDRVPLIGVVGNVKRWKGQETVVRTTALLSGRWPELRCMLVGLAVPDDPYLGELVRLAADLGIAGRVIFTGFQKQPADFLNAMDVVVHSSITPEPFGLVNIEAMYLRKPVVATRLGGPTEIFTDGEDGYLVPPAHPEALAEALACLLANPTLRMRIGDCAHATVLQRFTTARTVAGVQRVYEEIWASPRTVGIGISGA